MRKNQVPQRKCFVMMPYVLDNHGIYIDIIKETVEGLGIECGRADETCSTQAIIHDIVDSIKTADICIADITGRNPNVYYEIALAHAHGKRIIIIGQEYTNPEDEVAFDIAHLRRIPYSITVDGDWKFSLRERLRRTLESTLNSALEASMNFLTMLPPPNGTKAGNTTATKDVAIWHHSIHRKISKESLFYCLITIEPVYQRNIIFECIEKTIHALGIASYAIYETLGTTDLLLRVWLPKKAFEYQGNPAAVFQTEIQKQFATYKRSAHDTLPRLDVNAFQMIEIDGIYGHVLVHGNFTQALDEDTLNTIEADLTESKIAQIESLQHNEFIDRYFENHYIQKAAFGNSGMTFFVFITRPRDLADRYDHIFKELLKELDRGGRVRRASLYSTNHTKYGWILKGELSLGDDVNVINTEVIAKINSERTIAAHEIRTFTYPALLSRIVEKLHIESHEVRRQNDVQHLLTQEESPRFEVKGSIFVDIDFQLGRKGRDEKANIGPAMCDVILKEIAGFLNGKESARILIGALESKNYKTIDSIEAPNIPHDKLEELKTSPRIGDYIVIGFNVFEYASKVADYDKLERLLWEKISSKISPLASQSRISIDPVQFEDRDLMLITITGRGRNTRQTFLDGQKFYARRGSSTIQLFGPDIEEYEHSLGHR